MKVLSHSPSLLFRIVDAISLTCTLPIFFFRYLSKKLLTAVRLGPILVHPLIPPPLLSHTHTHNYRCYNLYKLVMFRPSSELNIKMHPSARAKVPLRILSTAIDRFHDSAQLSHVCRVVRLTAWSRLKKSHFSSNEGRKDDDTPLFSPVYQRLVVRVTFPNVLKNTLRSHYCWSI